MTLCGIASRPAPDGLYSLRRHKIGALSRSCHRSASIPSRGLRARCSTGNIASEQESRGSDRNGGLSRDSREELDPVLKFKMSDFAICDHVSIGHQGRADEVIFEATVSDSESPLYNSIVVLRQLTSLRAQRRGRRALEVLKKLARRQLMYHSYAMQVHGYVSPSRDEDCSSFTLVHGYHGSYSLRHWLQLSDWLPTLEATLALDEEQVRRVGDDTIGGPAVTRQMRLIRIVMRDLLIGVNYLHSQGLAHTELRLDTIHISPLDKHVKVGILGNSADFYDNSPSVSSLDGNVLRRKLMIAFDMRCVGFIMAKMVLKELMDASTFMKFKSFLTKGNDPSCLREFLLPILCRESPSGNAGLQMLDRNWGAGWNLLSLLLATKPSERISCLDALRHPFLCGPRWRIDPPMSVIRWGLGSTAVRMAEDYIYGRHQRSRIAYFIELMELLNPRPRLKNWLDFLPGKWRLLYCTGRHIGLTLRQASRRVLIGSVYLTFTRASQLDRHNMVLASDISFKVMATPQWPHDKSGSPGNLRIKSPVRISSGRRLYLREDSSGSDRITSQESVAQKLFSRKWRAAGAIKELPSSLPAAKLVSGEIDVAISLEPSPSSVDEAMNVLQEVRTQIPPEMFDVSKLVCGTYVDSRLMVLRGVNGSALLFTRSCPTANCT